jgi:hypothetical protein
MPRIQVLTIMLLYAINCIAQNNLPNIYTGGNNDGFHFNNVTNQNAIPNIYTGAVMMVFI